MPVETINVCEMSPCILAYSNITLPPRIFAIPNVHVELRGDDGDMRSSQTVSFLTNTQMW